jgi:hypothetical protein
MERRNADQQRMLTMVGPERIIHLKARPLKLGAGWLVVATYPDGRKEHISSFESQVEAQGWIDSDQSFEWVKERGYE